jgi:UDP-N-acetylmuramate--alanine ligase
LKIDNIHSVYFIGIGGIGMSALARWFNTNGYKVAGYDRTPSLLTSHLEKEGMQIHFEDDVKLIPAEFLKEDTLIIYTPAIPKEHSELNYFLNKKFIVKKRSEVLGLITESMFTIAVAGTHGKTTTSSMVAHLLKSAGKNVAAFLGGITQNYNTNLLLNTKGDDAMVVVEADEYDRSFLRLHPDIAVITSMDPDHLDIYENGKEFEKTFNDFAAQVEPGGSLIYKTGLNLDKPLNNQQYFTFGLENAAYRAVNSRILNAEFVFDIEASGSKKIDNVRLIVPGFHNIQNALAAFAVGDRLGIPADVMKLALATFKGVKRRFEYVVKRDDIIFIDDYAHHPTEIEAFLTSVKALYKGKKLTVIFQPHLFSRTRDFLEGFAESLSLADELLLMEIYPARELPIPGITSSVLLDKVSIQNKRLVSKSGLMEVLKGIETDILVTIGAGDIDTFVEPIEKMILNKKYV